MPYVVRMCLQARPTKRKKLQKQKLAALAAELNAQVKQAAAEAKAKAAAATEEVAEQASAEGR